ncbi:TNFAIP3-interacting protein 3-like [Xenia sp. Carnegie-2017]|uniref:TNFAIP3-interacting protein 3-like n=1 Tax=Xenia sp. Carnegie-2017 TaxID=2897299 RepID=UPI001F03658E|nr:TNFAIP3-interacting protein 3-like [Xenia sp. Carnegie-2017]
MNSETKKDKCSCKELKEKYELCVKDNERLAKIIRNLRQENDNLNYEFRNQTSRLFDKSSHTAGGEDKRKQKYNVLLEINHGWKNDYEQLEMRFKMVKKERDLLVGEIKSVKARITELEQRQSPLEDELGRLASTLYAQQSVHINCGKDDEEEKYEMLKSQILAYKEDFDRERKDREKLHDEKEMYKQKLEDSEEIIRHLTAELDACKGHEIARPGGWSENGFLSERTTSSQPNLYTYSYRPVDQHWRLEQQRRGIYPRRPSTAMFYGGDVEVDELLA